MFGLSKSLNRNASAANEHGFDAAYLGLDKANPYPVGTIDHKQWEWGYNEGIDLLAEHDTASNPYPPTLSFDE